jgi:hypothetical protein
VLFARGQLEVNGPDEPEATANATSVPGREPAIVKAAFGGPNRARLIRQYFANRESIPPSKAWQDVYRLILWVDQSNGLAHCYESDKSQPGKTWYGRSLAFHDWASRAFNVEPRRLAEHVDWLFRHATQDLATQVLRKAQSVTRRAEAQRALFADRGMPMPGEDLELVAIVTEILGDYLVGDIPSEKWQMLVQRLRQHLGQENKRKNLVGEGFEDTIAEMIRRTPGGANLDVRVRHLLHQLPGFNRARQGDKPNKVDVAVLRPGRRTLITAKWSLRADREKQFKSEYAEYVQAESDRQQFDYVFVTNEFDPARLMRACEDLAGNAHMFTHVVHINPEAIQATYAAVPSPRRTRRRPPRSGAIEEEESMPKVLRFIETGRLMSFDRWLQALVAE